MSGMAGMLALNDDVIITPVSELSDDVRAQAECQPSDFAVSRTRGRSGSSIIDEDSARLLDRFREPRSVVEAVILYAREKSADAGEVLESAYPFIKGMVQRQVLVAADSLKEQGDEIAAAWGAGTRLPIGEIVRALQVLDDSEVYQITRPNGDLAVLKVDRPRSASLPSDDPARLRREARVLAWLNGRVGPRLLEEGELEGRNYLVIELVAGVDAVTAMQEYREQSPLARQRASLEMARAICDAYATLHSLCAVHGDVHPRNVLVLRDGSVRLIDFGFASAIDDEGPIQRIAERGGVPFFFEPEFARAALDNAAPPPASAAGEQFAVAALIFSLATGEYWQRFRLGRSEMLHDIATGTPRRFVDCGSEPWLEFERVLGRALAHDPGDRWPSMAAMASAFAGLTPPRETHPRNASTAKPHLYERAINELRLDGPLFADALPAPSVSINYGAAGIALGALHVSQRRAAPDLLSIADAWLTRGMREMGDERGFFNSEIEITREMVGEASPYHSPSGVHAVDALIARASGNIGRQNLAVANFLECARRPAAGLDLTLGRSSTLLGAAMMLDALPQADASSEAALRAFGTQTMEDIWHQLDRKATAGMGDVDYLGVAHGWAGFLYATLTWCSVANVAVPAGVERRLDELAALALPSGRGMEWAWILGQPGDPPTMSGWCNGSCGYVFLFTLAHHLLGKARYLEVAVGAGWNSWESQDPAATLCCGLAGRGYALLNLSRHTGERSWLERAHALCARGAKASGTHREYPHSLYKGEFGVAVLAADLEDPEWGRMPFFEPAGYRV
jgi:eukaryotic-like serine/threonine-protein kinase